MSLKNGWTGGQYSLVRAVFGSYLFIHFAALIPWAHEVFEAILPRDSSPLLHLFPNVLALADVATPLVVIAAIASLFFSIGCHDRIAAIVIWYVLACLFGRNPLIANPSMPFTGWLLLVHAFLPSAPFGSWAARGRVDPRGNWSMPHSMYAAMWIVMSLSYSFSGWTKLSSPSWVDGTAMARVLANPLARATSLQELMLSLPSLLTQLATWSALALELSYAPLALFRATRPWIWGAMLIMHLGLLLLIDFADLSFMMIILHLFTLDPSWIPGRAPAATEIVRYDGSCGLCHRSVRLLLAEDRTGTAFRFAPLPDSDQASIIIETADGRELTRSDAVIHALHRLGGLWRALAVLFALVPRGIRDATYDRVAKVRYRIFGRTKDVCPVLPPDLRSRFIA